MASLNSSSDRVIMISDSEDEDDELARAISSISLNRASPTKGTTQALHAVKGAPPAKRTTEALKMQDHVMAKIFHDPSAVYVFHQRQDDLHAGPPPQYSEPAEPGNEAQVYRRWTKVNQLKQQDPSLVFKGFPTWELAQASWDAARSTGVVSALQRGMGRGYWVVIQGVHPSIYHSPWDALRDGLEWGGGFLTAFSSKAEAQDYWNTQSNASPCRIISTARPGFFD
ncbi:hypothetical protein C8R42DRAFT_644753 [Lentinula raphanica]|nr:hypothetical protein C8R42DRAFT_644753 [Lentinula raphanica]